MSCGLREGPHELFARDYEQEAERQDKHSTACHSHDDASCRHRDDCTAECTVAAEADQCSVRGYEKIFAKIEWKDTSKNPTGSKNNSLSR